MRTQRHDTKEPHSIAEASYLEAHPSAPPLNSLRPSGQQHNDGGAERSAIQNNAGRVGVQGLPFLPPPPPVPPQGSEFPFSFPFPFPMPGLPMDGMPVTNKPWPQPSELPWIPPPPPGFDVGGATSLYAKPWPTPFDVPMPSSFPFPPSFLPPPPPLPQGMDPRMFASLPSPAEFFAAQAAAQPKHQSGHSHNEYNSNINHPLEPYTKHRNDERPRASADLPWLPPGSGDSDADDIAVRRTDQLYRVDGGEREGREKQLYSAASHQSGRSASLMERDRMKALADSARHKFIGQPQGGSTRSSSRDSWHHQDPVALQPQEAKRAATGFSNVYTPRHLTSEDIRRLREDREARINARRNSVHNVTTPLRKASPNVSQTSNSLGAKRLEVFRRQKEKKTEGQSPSLTYKATAATPNHNNTTLSLRTRTPTNKGVTLRALKGETPDLGRTLRDGLPSEQRRLADLQAAQREEEYHRASAANLRESNQSATGKVSPQKSAPFVGFGATTYAPFVELAKKDPRAAEYLRGIEHMYHNLRQSYEEFQQDPEKFLKKGPSMAAIQRVVTSPQRSSKATAPPQQQQQQQGESTMGVRPSSTTSQRQNVTIDPITPPRLPVHASELTTSSMDAPNVSSVAFLNVEPSFETRKLREELDRLETQWQRLADVRAQPTVASSSPRADDTGESGAAPFEVAPSSSSTLKPTTRESVAKQVRERMQQRQASNTSAAAESADDVFTYDNVLGLVKERKALLATTR